MEKRRGLLLRKCVYPAPRGYISACLVDRPENHFFYNCEYLKEHLGVTNNQKSSVPGHGYFSKLEKIESLHCEKGELYMKYRRMSCQERNGQLCQFCHIPTMASCQPSMTCISLGVQLPPMAVSRTTSSQLGGSTSCQAII